MQLGHTPGGDFLLLSLLRVSYLSGECTNPKAKKSLEKKKKEVMFGQRLHLKEKKNCVGWEEQANSGRRKAYVSDQSASKSTKLSIQPTQMRWRQKVLEKEKHVRPPMPG